MVSVNCESEIGNWQLEIKKGVKGIRIIKLFNPKNPNSDNDKKLFQNSIS